MASPARQPQRVDPALLEARRARRRERVIRRLLEVVDGLLEEQDSYLEISVERILEASEMSRSTFYRYFDDKIDLILALGESAIADISAAAQAIWELPPEASREELEQAVRDALGVYLPHTRVMTALLEVATYDRRAREQFLTSYREGQRALAQHIRTGQATATVRPGLHPDETAGWLTWMVERGMTQLLQGASKPRITRLVESLTDILWQTLYATTDPRRDRTHRPYQSASRRLK